MRTDAAADELDVCRVCRSGAAEDGPLRHPCMCSGSIGFVHEVCIAEWHAVSKRTRCELCGYAMRFSKVYSDMPAKLPPLLLVRRFLGSVLKIGLLLLHTLLAITAWLVVLPYLASWIWRIQLGGAEELAALFRPLKHAMCPAPAFGEAAQAAPVVANGWTALLQTVGSDVVSGQIISASVVCAFVLVFMVREWVMQNEQPPPAVVLAMAIPPVAGPPAILLPPHPIGQAGMDDLGIAQLVEIQRVVEVLRGNNIPWHDPEQEWATWQDTEEESEAVDTDGYSDDGSVADEDKPNRWPGRASSSHAAVDDDESWDMDLEAPAAPASSRSRRITNRDRDARRRRRSLERRTDEIAPNLPPSPGRTVRPLPRRSPINAPAALYYPPDLPPPLNAQEAGERFGIHVPAPVVIARVDHEHEPVIEEREGFGEDFFEDLAGVWEAVGLTSVVVLVQNLFLMTLLLSACLGAAVMVPLLIGKLLAVTKLVKVFALPLRAVRTISDPLFDAAFSALLIVPRYLLSSTVSKLFPPTPPAAVPKVSFVTSIWRALIPTIRPATSIAPPTPPSLVQRLSPALADAPASVTAFLKSAVLGVQEVWASLAVNDAPVDRVLCIALGYVAMLSCVALYVSNTGNEFSRGVIGMARHQLLLAKLVLFVTAEVILFPACCGLIVNLVTIPLFPGTTILTRLAFCARSPFAAAFLTWLAGTTFMFAFSMVIDTIRNDIVRPGVLWFIRSPAEEFHPLREIMDRKSSAQARKILVSGLLYASVILAVFGTSVGLLHLGGMLPLRWSYESLTSVPLDLIAFRFLLPFTLEKLDPRAHLHGLFVRNATYTARVFRLSSLLFGKRVEHEEREVEGIPQDWGYLLCLSRLWRAWEEHSKESDVTDGPAQAGGTFARVPASDDIKMVSPGGSLIETDQRGMPVNEAGAKVLAEQITSMINGRHGDKYQVVYLPPRWRIRTMLFVISVWATSILTALVLFVTPVLVGRSVFASYLPPSIALKVHDLYSFMLGVYAILPFVLLFPALGRARHFGVTLATPFHLLHLAASVSLTPLVVAAFVELFVLFPLTGRTTVVPSPSASGQVPTVHVLQSWCMGVFLLSLAEHLLRLPRFSTLGTARWLKATFPPTGQTHPLPLMARIRNLNADLVPGLFRFTAVIIVTLSIAAALVHVIPGHSYHVALRIVTCSLSSIGVQELFKPLWNQSVQAWIGRVKEAEFLIDRRLEDYDATVSPESVPI